MSRQRFEAARLLMINRIQYETKQRIYSLMRHEGLRRRNKPFPTASDGHYPMVDMAIRKQKPFWLGQVMAGNRLASFVAMREQQEALTEAAADWFHFRVFQQSNFTQRIRTVVDTMLLRGRGVLKITTNPFENHALVFEAIDPMFLLVPDTANDLEDADEFIHVQQWTKAKYMRNRRFDQSPDTIRQIVGVQSTDTLIQYVRDKGLREGITHLTEPNRIVLWEHWVKSPNGWSVYTYSPQNPDLKIRAPFGLIYKWQGKPSFPFFSFPMEIKDDGWFSPRGLGELLAPWEAYLTKLLNEKADSITFSNRPVLTADGDIPNIANIRWQPGEIIPMNLRGVQMPAPPFSYDSEMMFARGVAEQQAMTPDFGITDQADQAKPRTATENDRISALQNAGMNDNAQMFRDVLTKCYRHVWALLCQFKATEFSYYSSNKLGMMPQQALHDAYLIFPDGSPDGWNRQKRLQMSMARLQMFAGNPNVSVEELTKEALYADDPRVALKAFVPTNQKAATESEDEAMEILVLVEGFPAAVTMGEDHATRIMVLLGWLQKQTDTNAPLNPVARQRVQEHLAAHFQYLQQTNPEGAKQLMQQIEQMSQSQAMPQQPAMI